MTETQTDPKTIDELYRATAAGLIELFEHPQCSRLVAARIEALVIAIYQALEAANSRRPRSLLRLVKNFFI